MWKGDGRVTVLSYEGMHSGGEVRGERGPRDDVSVRVKAREEGRTYAAERVLWSVGCRLRYCRGVGRRLRRRDRNRCALIGSAARDESSVHFDRRNETMSSLHEGAGSLHICPAMESVSLPAEGSHSTHAMLMTAKLDAYPPVSAGHAMAMAATVAAIQRHSWRIPLEGPLNWREQRRRMIWVLR